MSVKDCQESSKAQLLLTLYLVLVGKGGAAFYAFGFEGDIRA